MTTRREFFASVLGGSAAALYSAGVAGRTPGVVIRIVAGRGRVAVLPGERTDVLRFSGAVLEGRRDSLLPGESYLGPTLNLLRGERVRIDFQNLLREPTIVHWHGLIVPEAMDGHPRHAVPPGGSYRYEFDVTNPAGTYLYHPHPHGRTGHQVYFGLAGLIVIREPWEQDAGLPQVEHEIPMVLQDRSFDGDNRLLYSRSMMDTMNGFLADSVLVNGKPDAVFDVPRGIQRLRIANVSNSRIYKLAWSDGSPLTVVGVDNGLLSAEEGPQERPFVVLAPFERVELIEDFGRRRQGAEAEMISAAFDVAAGMMGGGMMRGRGMMGGGGMMRGGMMGNSGQGREMPIARFRVSGGSATRPAPLRLPSVVRREPGQAHSMSTELGFRHMQGTLNGRSFDMEEVAQDERLPLSMPTVWTFSNPVSGMMSMPHPMHIHGVRFRVLERRGGDQSLTPGLVDSGFKDTVLVLSGQQVKVLLQPTEPGMFMYHCHNLEHEDAGMMRNCQFGS